MRISACRDTAGSTDGTRWRRASHTRPAPPAIAAWWKPEARTSAARVRACTAIGIHATDATATAAPSSPGPSTAAVRTPISTGGSAFSTSAAPARARWPATPKSVPSSSATRLTATPAPTLMSAPWLRRAHRSRPSASVPIGLCGVGGSRRAPSATAPGSRSSPTAITASSTAPTTWGARVLRGATATARASPDAPRAGPSSARCAAMPTPPTSRPSTTSTATAAWTRGRSWESTPSNAMCPSPGMVKTRSTMTEEPTSPAKMSRTCGRATATVRTIRAVARGSGA